MDCLHAACFMLVLGSVAAAEDLRVLPLEYGPTVMPLYMTRLADEALAARATRFEALKTVDDVQAYQQDLRAFFERQIGGFPERTPLNAQVTGQLQRDGYRVEKILFESRPNFHVTAALFLPDAPGPHPVVLSPCGHSPNGKAFEAYQRVCILLAKNGIAAFIFDPIDQGERHQMIDETGNVIFAGTDAHTYLGVGSSLLGMGTAAYEIWDGMRAIDYLETRNDIDRDRIGCTGNSGGGTQTAYLIALDDRIKAAAPSCYITSFGRLIHTIGPQDAEQNIAGQLAHGMDHADYLIMFAPRPIDILAATRDFFDIEGTWASYRQANRIYTRLGFPERATITEVDTEHGFLVGQRQSMVRWMMRWLRGIDEPIVEDEFAIMTDEELQVTPEGEVMRLANERSAFELNVDLEEALVGQRREFQSALDAEAFRKQVRDLCGVRPLDSLPSLEARPVGEDIDRSGYRIQKRILTLEPGIDLPALWFLPEAQTQDPVLYLHGTDKGADAQPGGAIESMVHAGHAVLAVDMRGVGETESSSTLVPHWTKPFGSDWQEVVIGQLVNRTYVAMRAEDIASCARYLTRFVRPADTAVLLAEGEMTVPALHAAALEPQLFSKVVLRNGIRSWAEVVRTPVTENQLVNVIHGVLRYYDLPDLERLLPEGALVVESPVSPGPSAA